jgi:hypothetical protein
LERLQVWIIKACEHADVPDAARLLRALLAAMPQLNQQFL